MGHAINEFRWGVAIMPSSARLGHESRDLRVANLLQITETKVKGSATVRPLALSKSGSPLVWLCVGR